MRLPHHIQVAALLSLSVTLAACGGTEPTSSSATALSSNGASSSVTSSSITSNPTSSSASHGEEKLVVAINAGGGDADLNGIAYQADSFANGGSSHSTDDVIEGDASGLYQSERYGGYSYNIPVSDGSYRIQLHFAEIYHEAAGNRLIQINIENARLVDGLDVFAEAGHDRPYSLELEGITVADGYLTLEVDSSAGDGSLAGFAVYSADGELVTPPAPPVYAYADENTGSDCGINLADLPAANTLTNESKLPYPMTGLDGTDVTKTSQWRCRKQEIRLQAQKYLYGEKPAEPARVSGSVTNTRITVEVEDQGQQITFSAEMVLPSTGQAPFPAIINVGGKGGFGGITLGESRILQQGVAVIYYNHYDLGQEGTPENSRHLPNPGKFYDLYGGNHSAGLLTSWAWGASRLIDVLQTQGQDLIDTQGLGVTGCSRNGKGAFAIGLFDERIALTIPHETSTAGVPAYRIVDVLNTERTDHNFYGLNWLSNDFEPFVLNTEQLPIDSHTLIASFAPRGLLVLENPHERQMSAPAGHMAALGGSAVYEALGVGENISYHSDVANTGHCSYKNNYTDLLVRNIAKFLKHEAATTGDFTVGSGGSLSTADWIDWQVPPLEQDAPLLEE